MKIPDKYISALPFIALLIIMALFMPIITSQESRYMDKCIPEAMGQGVDRMKVEIYCANKYMEDING